MTKKLEEVNEKGEPIGIFLVLGKNNTLDPNFSCAYANVTKSIYNIMYVSSKFSIELINQYNKKTKKRRIALW